MDYLIKMHQKYPFTDNDILKFSNCNLILYEDLKDYSDIDEVLGPENKCILLYQQEKNYGHWVCLTRARNGDIEFFDSYGRKPDYQFKYSTYNKNNGPKYLSILLINCPYRVIYNPFRLQSKRVADMSTCGRWVSLRLHMSDIPVIDFAKMFLNQKFPPDWYATALTMFIA